MDDRRSVVGLAIVQGASNSTIKRVGASSFRSYRLFSNAARPCSLAPDGELEPASIG